MKYNTLGSKVHIVLEISDIWTYCTYDKIMNVTLIFIYSVNRLTNYPDNVSVPLCDIFLL